MTTNIPSKVLVNQATSLTLGLWHEDEGITICTRFEKELVIFILALDNKGYRVSFKYGQVLMWYNGNTLEDVVAIGKEKGGLYKLKGHPETTLFHETTNSSELWHRRLAHINCKPLPYVSKVVKWLLHTEIR